MLHTGPSGQWDLEVPQGLSRRSSPLEADTNSSQASCTHRDSRVTRGFDARSSGMKPEVFRFWISCAAYTDLHVQGGSSVTRWLKELLGQQYPRSAEHRKCHQGPRLKWRTAASGNHPNLPDLGAVGREFISFCRVIAPAFDFMSDNVFFNLLRSFQ